MKKRIGAVLTLMAFSLGIFSAGGLYTAADDAAAQTVTVEDSELHWYNNEVRVRAAGATDVKDSARILRYNAEGQPHERIPLHGEDDNDEVAVQWMYALGAAGINEKDYDILYKDLATPVMGGEFAFKFWFRNAYGEEDQNSAFKIRGVAYEIDGTAHELDELALAGWSGDGQNEGCGWYSYSAALPADKVIHRVAVKIYRPAGSQANIGLDDWSVIDGVKFVNTVLVDDAVAFLGVDGWKASWTGEELAPTGVTGDAFGGEYGQKVMIDGGFTYHPDDYKPDQSISKELAAPAKGGYLSFKMENKVNSTVPGQPQFQMFANVYDAAGTKYELGLQPQGEDYLPFSSSGTQMYFGFTRYVAPLPADKEIVKVEIGMHLLTEDVGMGANSAVFFATDIKLVDSAYQGSEDEGEDGEEGGGEELPPTYPEFPERTDFTPDSAPAGTDVYEDSELGWYNNDVYYNAGVLVDHVRIIKYEEGFTESDGWSWIKNFFIRPETDSDEYALQFMAVVNHPLTEQRPYDIIYKDLSVPVEGGTFDFYFWFRNGYEYNHNVFALEAYAFDAEGNAYGLGAMPNAGEAPGLAWSGDHVNVAAGWYHYSAAMPKDVPIVRLGIKVFKPDLTTTGVLGPVYNGEWFAEEWFAIDEIRVIDTTILDEGYTFDDEQGWESDYSSLAPMGEYLNPWCILQGDTAIEMENYFNYDEYPDYTNIYKEFDEAISGGQFAFSLYNVTNSYMDSQPKFQVDVYGYKEGAGEAGRVKLGTYPEEEDGYLKYSGSTDSYQLYNGWNSVVVDIPEDAEFTKLEIVIREITGVESDGVLIFLDDIKFMGSTFGAFSSSDGETDTDTDGKQDSQPETSIPATGGGSVLPIVACLLAAAAVAACFGFRRDERVQRS